MTQHLTEPEVALEEARDQETPLGPRHLHWVHRDGGGHWLVRGQKKSSLCGTIRCRKVYVLEEHEGRYVDIPLAHQEPVPEQHGSDCPECIAHEKEQFDTEPEVFLSLKPSFGPVPVEGHREF